MPHVIKFYFRLFVVISSIRINMSSFYYCTKWNWNQSQKSNSFRIFNTCNKIDSKIVTRTYYIIKSYCKMWYMYISEICKITFSLLFRRFFSLFSGPYFEIAEWLGNKSHQFNYIYLKYSILHSSSITNVLKFGIPSLIWNLSFYRF